MRKKQNHTGAKLDEKLFLTTDELADYLSVGVQNACKISAVAGATVKIGKLVRHDRKQIDQYFQAMH